MQNLISCLRFFPALNLNVYTKIMFSTTLFYDYVCLPHLDAITMFNDCGNTYSVALASFQSFPRVIKDKRHFLFICSSVLHDQYFTYIILTLISLNKLCLLISIVSIYSCYFLRLVFALSVCFNLLISNFFALISDRLHSYSV